MRRIETLNGILRCQLGAGSRIKAKTMFVLLMVAPLLCLLRVRAPQAAQVRPSAPAMRAAWVAKWVATARTPALAFIHVPLPRLTP